jgi:squalene cyclase
MSEDNITVKVSGSAVYKAVKQYLDSSEHIQKTIQQTLDKHLDETVKSRVTSMLDKAQRDTSYKIKSEIDKLIIKEVEDKVTAHVIKALKKIVWDE